MQYITDRCRPYQNHEQKYNQEQKKKDNTKQKKKEIEQDKIAWKDQQRL